MNRTRPAESGVVNSITITVVGSKTGRAVTIHWPKNR